eukprot:evm.model.NODE_10021_length_12419_cov_17.493679.3
MRKTNTTDDGRQPLSSRPTRGAAKSRFGFVVPPAGTENQKTNNSSSSNAPAAAAAVASSTPQALPAKLPKVSTFKGAGVVIPRRRPAAGGDDAGIVAAAAATSGSGKTGCLVPVEEEVVYQQQQQEEEMISAIEGLALQMFGEEEERAKVERLARGKLTMNNKWDFKEKISKRDEAIRSLRQGFSSMLTQKDEFVSAAVEVEMGLRTDFRKARIAHALVADLTTRNRTVEAQLETLKAERNEAVKQAAVQAEANDSKGEEVEKLKSELDENLHALESTRAEAAAAEAARASLAAAIEEHAAQQQVLREGLGKELNDAKAALETLRVERDGLMEAKASLEKDVAELRGSLKEGQGRSAAEAGERARLEAEAVKMGEELKTLRETVTTRGEQVAQTRLEAEKRVGELQQELMAKEGLRREGEVARNAAEAEAAALRVKLEGTQATMEEKNKELSMALKSFADMQRSAQEREGELRQLLCAKPQGRVCGRGGCVGAGLWQLQQQQQQQQGRKEMGAPVVAAAAIVAVVATICLSLLRMEILRHLHRGWIGPSDHMAALLLQWT